MWCIYVCKLAHATQNQTAQQMPRKEIKIDRVKRLVSIPMKKKRKGIMSMCPFWSPFFVSRKSRKDHQKSSRNAQNIYAGINARKITSH